MSRARRKNPNRLTVAQIELRIEFERRLRSSRDEVCREWQMVHGVARTWFSNELRSASV